MEKSTRKYNIMRKISAYLLIIAVVFTLFNPKETSASRGIDITYKQVKTSDDSTIYYLDHERGVKKAYVSEKAFLSYGNKWSDVKVVNREDLDKWPQVRLVKTLNNSTVYYIQGANKIQIKSAQDFLAFGFNWNEVVTILQADLDEYKLATYNDMNPGISQKVEQGKLNISLDHSSPKGDFVAVNTQGNLIAVFNFAASDSDVQIQDITFSLKGVFDSSVVKRVYITNESNARYGQYGNINSDRQVVIHTNNEPIVIQKGQARKIKVYVDFNDYENCNNMTFEVSVNNNKDINTKTVVTGVFPVKSNTFKLVYAAQNFGKIKVEEQSLNASKLVVGDDRNLLGRFTIAETSGNEDIIIDEIILENIGTAKDNDVSHFELRDKNNKLISSSRKFSNRKYIYFDLKDYKLERKASQVFYIYGDVQSGENKTLNLELKSIELKGKTYEYNINASYVSNSNVQTIARKTIQAVSQGLKTNKYSKAEERGVVLGNFEIKHLSDTVKIESINFRLEKNASALELNKVFYVVNYDTGEVIDYFDGDKFSRGFVQIDLGEYLLKAKKTLNIAIQTDIPEDVKDGDYYQIVLDSVNYRNEDESFFTDRVSVLGEKLIISKSSIFAYPNKEEGEQSFTKGQKKVQVASFIIETASGKDAVLDSLTISRVSGSDNLTHDQGFENLYLRVGTKKSQIINEPSSGTYFFEELNYKLRAGRRIEVGVYVDTDSSLKAEEIQLAITNIVAHNDDSGFSTIISGINIQSFKTYFSLLNVDLGAFRPGYISEGEDMLVGSFNLKNNSAEEVKLDEITINTLSDGFSSSLGYENLRLVAKDSKGKERSLGKERNPVAGSNTLSLRSYRLEGGEQITIFIYVDAENPSSGGVDVYLSNLDAFGSDSRIQASVNGDPSEVVAVRVR